MASPTLDLICCAVHSSISPNISKWNASHMQDVIMSDARPYHRGELAMPLVYNICAILSSCLSIVGAVYILLPKKAYVPRQRQSFRVVQRHRKILTWLSVADVLASVGVLTIAIANLSQINLSVHHNNTEEALHNATENNLPYKYTCIISTAWIQYFFVATYFWTFFYAVDVHLMLRGKNRNLFPLYSALSWLLPGVMVGVGLGYMYKSSALDLKCDPTVNAWTYLLPHYLVSYVPMFIVLSVNPILYWYSAKKVGPLLMARGIYTDRERKIQSQVQNKFLMIVVVFTVCWLPNVINGCFLFRSVVREKNIWHEFNTFSAIIWVATAIMNPLQAFLNAIIYWGRGGCTRNVPTQFTDSDYNYVRYDSDDDALLRRDTSHGVYSDSNDETSPLVQDASGWIQGRK
ncbi:G-protein coupled receptor 143-like [Asterias amurensis]|uniref:G-protein coupled receptor 143-like n=1 Tax=Asterias amurensis TaxID=7602 RepID=UPI003AB7E9ED